jgi:WD40 repeat protein
MMAKRPEDRYPTPLAVALGLEPFCVRPPVAIPLSTAERQALLAGPPQAVPVATSPPAPGGTPAVLASTVLAPVVGAAGEETPLPGAADSVPCGPGRARPLKPRGWRRGLVAAAVGGAGLAGCVVLALLLRPAPPRSVLDRLDAGAIPAGEVYPGQPKDLLVAVLGNHRVRHLGPIAAFAVSPDSKWVATGGTDWVIRISDTETMHQQYVLPAPTRSVRALAFSPKEKLLASAGADGTIRLWDLTTGKERRRLGEADASASGAVAFAPDGRRLLSGHDDGIVRLWNVATGQNERPFTGHTSEVTSVAFSPDGTKAVSCGRGDADRVRLWDLETGQEAARLGVGGPYVQACIFAEGKRVLVGRDGVLVAWDVATGKEVPLPGDGRERGHAAFSGDERRLLTCDLDHGRGRGVSLWDPASPRKPLREFARTDVVAAVFLADDRRVLLAAWNTLYQWDSETGKELQEPVGHWAGVTGLAFSGDDRYLLSAGADGRLCRWDLATAREDDPKSPFPRVDTTRLALSPGDRYALAVGLPPDPLHLFDVASRKEVRKLTCSNNSALSYVFLSDGQALTGSQDGTLRLWDVEHGTEVLPPQSLPRPVGIRQLVPATAPGQFFCTLAGGAIALWDRNGGKELRLFAPPGGASVIAFDARANLLYFGSDDGTVGMYDLKARPHETTEPKPGAEPPPATYHRWHQGGVQTLALSPGGEVLVTADATGRVILWNTAFLRGGAGEQKFLEGWQQPDGVNDLAFAHDGRHLAVANGNGTIYLLRLPLPRK